MRVVGHDDVPTNSPTMTIMSCAPFVDEDFGKVDASQKRLSMASACCHKINLSVDPNVLQSAQVLVHAFVVDEGVDLGNLNASPPRSAPAATASALGRKYGFGIRARNSAHRNPTETANERAE